MELKEYHLLESSKVDRDNGVIRGVKVLGKTSKNNREYTDRALDEARALYEGVGVNIDHPAKNTAPRDRRFDDGFGKLLNVTRNGDGVFADLHYLKSHPMAERVAEAAERMADQFGLSHNAEGEINRKSGKAIVESVKAVHSVDIVRYPATNTSLFEAENKMPTTVTKKAKAILAEAYPENWKLVAKQLREMEGEDGPMADMPVEVPETGGSTDDQVKAAFRAMVIAAFDDDSLDAKATLTKIKEILGAQDKLMGGGKKEASADPPAKTEESDKTPADPALQKFMERFEATERRNMLRDVLEESGYRMADLSPERKRLIEKQADEDAVRDLVESWGPAVQAKGSGRRETVRESDQGGKFASDPKDFAKAIQRR